PKGIHSVDWVSLRSTQRTSIFILIIKFTFNLRIYVFVVAQLIAPPTEEIGVENPSNKKYITNSGLTHNR
ncbi:hypothetical protein J4G08_20570, partial [Candidatus Poribacteria bacterium]|nr:hypothetical protein [Candidatus Poribacteria bacterium]